MGSLRWLASQTGFGGLLRKELVRGLDVLGVHSPNEVQARTLPLALSGRDVVVCAQTGSGKTLLFLLPFIQRLAEEAAPLLHPTSRLPELQPEAIIVVPTHELALQVTGVAKRISAEVSDSVRITCITDAQPPTPEAVSARLVVATPREVLALHGTGALGMQQLRFVAVDEADTVLCDVHREDELSQGGDQLLRMLKSGGRVAEGSSELHGEHGGSGDAVRPPQFVLTSATLRTAHEETLCRCFPAAKLVTHKGVLVPTLRQRFLYFRGDKDAKLLAVLRNAWSDSWLFEGSTLVFCSDAAEAARVHALLQSELDDGPGGGGASAGLLHEELPAAQRGAVAEAFRADEITLLVSSGVATRGLDFPALRHVVLCDVTSDVAAFVHAAGRTARRGQSGMVTCLLPSKEGAFRHQGHHALQSAAKLDFAPSDREE